MVCASAAGTVRTANKSTAANRKSGFMLGGHGERIGAGTELYQRSKPNLPVISQLDGGFAKSFHDLCIDIIEALVRQVSPELAATFEQAVGIVERRTLREG